LCADLVVFCCRFVANHRKDLTLERFASELESYIAKLDNTLVNIINDDYSAFLKLSSMLIDIDALVAGLRDPLGKLETKLQAVRSVVDTPLRERREVLDKLVQLREKRGMMELCMNAWETMEKVQLQLEQLREKNTDNKEDNGNSSSTMEENRAEALGRATQRLARVTFLAQENSSLPLLRQIRAKARSVEQALLEELESAFIGSVNLEEGDPKKIAVILRAYVAIGQADESMRVFKDKFVQPRVASILTQANVDAGGQRGRAQGLNKAYKEVLDFVKRKCYPTLQAVKDTREGLGNIDFMSKGIAAGVSDVIVKNLDSIYASGNASVLHESYIKTDALFKILHGFAMDSEYMRQLHMRLLSKWNLSVYVQLRTHELLKEMDASLHTQPAYESGSDFLLQATREVVQLFNRCWEPDVFLEVVAPKLFKTALQLIHAYICWSVCVVDILKEEKGLSSLEIHEELIDLIADQGDLKEELRDFWKDQTGDMIAMLSMDTRKLAGFVQDQIPKVQEKVISSTAVRGIPQATEAIRRAFQDVISPNLEHISDACMNLTQQDFAQESFAVLSHGMKSIVPMYNMTNKPMPTDASDYATKVMAPLRSFRQGSVAGILPKEASSEAIKTSLISLLKEFDAFSTSALQEVTNRENALRRLNRNTGNQQMDSDKIRLQFKLDVKKISQEALELGIDLRNEPAFDSLLSKLSTS